MKLASLHPIAEFWSDHTLRLIQGHSDSFDREQTPVLHHCACIAVCHVCMHHHDPCCARPQAPAEDRCHSVHLQEFECDPPVCIVPRLLLYTLPSTACIIGCTRGIAVKRCFFILVLKKGWDCQYYLAQTLVGRLKIHVNDERLAAESMHFFELKTRAFFWPLLTT